MNNAELIIQVSEVSGINTSDCEKVIKAFEQVLENKFAESQGAMNAIDKAYKILNYLRFKNNNSVKKP
jgi:hypothetical protein